MGDPNFAGKSKEELQTTLQKAMDQDELTGEHLAGLVEALDANTNGRLDDDELAGAVDGDVMYLWNVHFHPDAEPPKRVNRTAPTAVRQVMMNLFEASASILSSMVNPPKVRRAPLPKFPKFTPAPQTRSSKYVAQKTTLAALESK